MNKYIGFLFISLTLTAVAAIQPPGTLQGRWLQKFQGNVTVRSIYRADGTLDIFVNGKTFVSGKYKVSHDTLLISDPICGVDYYGMYRLNFITPDSVQPIFIQDTCRVRSNSIRQSPALSREKSPKP